MAAATTTYHGNCHCGRFRFDVAAPEITHAVACACSLCAKKGYLWLVPAEGGFRVTRDEGRLKSYESASLRDQFCEHCATGVVGEHLDGPLKGKLAVNIRSIRDVNPYDLEPSTTTIKAVEEQKRVIDPPPAPASEPPAQHIASCHCGKVQAELLVPIQEQEVKEDNCSSCVRNAYVGVYPTKDQVRIHGREHAVEYLHGRKYGSVSHCGTCGVSVFGTVYGPPLSVFDKVPPERLEHVMSVYHKNMNMSPLNVRAIEGLQLGSIQVNRSDEGTAGYELDP